MILDLETLKHVKFSFELHSDNSTMCNGYRSLCRMIEEAEGKVNENFAQPAVISSSPCHHNFIQKDTYWKSCTHCGMIAPLGQ